MMTKGPSQALNLGGRPFAYGDSFVSLDLMKGADNYRYQGPTGDLVLASADLNLDARGWLKSLPVIGGVETNVWLNVFYTKVLPPGKYVLEWQGEGNLLVYQDYTVIGPNKVLIDYKADYVGDDGKPVDDGITVVIGATDPNKIGNYIHDIKLYDIADTDLIAAGEQFNPDWQDRIDDFRILRTHDWQSTNFPSNVDWTRNVVSADQANWGIDGRGMPYELIVKIANETRSDLWINIPHTASDDFMRQAANYVKANLNGDLKLHVEFSNEYWTTIFDQHPYFVNGGIATYGTAEFSTGQFYGVKAANMADIFGQVFGASSTQLKQVLTVDNVAFLNGEAESVLLAPAAVAQGGTAPVTQGFDEIATDGYLLWDATSPYYADMITDWMKDADGGFGRARDFLINQLNTELLPSWQAGRVLANKYGLDFTVYEGGALLLNEPAIGEGNPIFTDFALRFTKSSEMRQVYQAELAAWKSVGTGPFAWYADVGRPGDGGDYGHWKGPDFVADPRTGAIVAANAQTAPWWSGDTRPASTFDNGLYDAGTAGRDRMQGTALADRLYGLQGADRLSGLDGADKLWGGAGNDQIYGGRGRDDINGGAGKDVLDGGSGRDQVDYQTSAAGVVVNLATGKGFGGDAQGDRLRSIESINGSAFADRLTGNAAANALAGGSGNDRLRGGGGADSLTGGAGADSLTGGAGNDQFVFYSAADGGDSVTDFSAAVGNDDQIYLSGAGFGNHVRGALAASEFQATNSSAAASTAVRIIYNTATHDLYYDADGSGVSAAVLLMTMANGAVVSDSDFVFF